MTEDRKAPPVKTVCEPYPLKRFHAAELFSSAFPDCVMLLDGAPAHGVGLEQELLDHCAAVAFDSAEAGATIDFDKQRIRYSYRDVSPTARKMVTVYEAVERVTQQRFQSLKAYVRRKFIVILGMESAALAAYLVFGPLPSVLAAFVVLLYGLFVVGVEQMVMVAGFSVVWALLVGLHVYVALGPHLGSNYLAGIAALAGFALSFIIHGVASDKIHAGYV